MEGRPGRCRCCRCRCRSGLDLDRLFCFLVLPAPPPPPALEARRRPALLLEGRSLRWGIVIVFGLIVLLGMVQLKQAVDDLRNQIDGIVATSRTSVMVAIEGRKSELLNGDSYAKATPEAQQHVVERVDQILARVASESQVALIQQIGSIFESRDFPTLLDLLTASHGGGEPPKQTVSVKTVVVTGVSGVLETEADVDKYLDALRTALVQTLHTGKRISL